MRGFLPFFLLLLVRDDIHVFQLVWKRDDSWFLSFGGSVLVSHLFGGVTPMFLALREGHAQKEKQVPDTIPRPEVQ